MNSPISDSLKLVIRPFQYRDLETLATLAAEQGEGEQSGLPEPLAQQFQQVQRWYGLLKFFSWFPNPFQHHFSAFVAESEAGERRLHGLIQIAPFNQTRSTWRVGRVLIVRGRGLATDSKEIGSQLLRYCFETIWEARTWLLEVNINEEDTLALYRQHGFQPLAQITYWRLSPDLLGQLAQHQPHLPNLLPISNADAQLLYQLDCVSMPPLLRQVFDRHIHDFKTSFLLSLLAKIQHWCSQQEIASGYVFEPQRKAAIGYFKLQFSKDGSRPHQAELTVHPAYTWLYPELLSQMARLAGQLPPQFLTVASADYQHEREEYLETIGAERSEHTLLMSRSVWHKLREVKPEARPLSEVLQGLQPVPRTPIPSRFSWLQWPTAGSQQSPVPPEGKESPLQSPVSSQQPENGRNIGEQPNSKC